jgi:hypothetical protein
MQFNPRAWNEPHAQLLRKCYAYGLNRHELGLVQLGCAKNPRREYKLEFIPPETYVKRGFLESLAQDDGLERVRPRAFDPAKEHILAILGSHFADSEGYHSDFHICRLDGNGGWSEKRGKRNVTDKDEDGNPLAAGKLLEQYAMLMARNVPRLLDARFAGYYRVPEKGIKVVPVPSPLLTNTR